MFNEPVSRWDVKDVKDKAKIAKTINWSKVKDMMKKLLLPERTKVRDIFLLVPKTQVFCLEIQ